MTEENHDVFSEGTEAATEAPAETEAQVEVTTDAKQEAETQTEEQSGAEEPEQQGEETAEPPAANGDNKVSQPEKMIPESRFKAALKDVNAKLTERDRELATLKAQPAPDRATDPDGYDRHVRIETSKAIMMETHEDYDEKIAHFQKMAETSPSLNEIVGNHAIPAKFAYDLAKKDMEITELSNLKDDPEYKEFQEYKKQKANSADTAAKLSSEKPAKAASKVPNLNRNATAASIAKDKASDESDDLWTGHYSASA